MTIQRDSSFRRRRAELVEILPNVRRFALSLCGNLADADDLLQSTVERILRSGLPDEAELLPWAFKICRNLWIDEIRSHKVRQKAGADPNLPGQAVVDGESEVMGQLSLRELQTAMALLTAEQRAVLELVAVEGYAYRQAAEILDIPIGTVMSRLARARTTLIEATAGPITSPGEQHD